MEERGSDLKIYRIYNVCLTFTSYALSYFIVWGHILINLIYPGGPPWHVFAYNRANTPVEKTWLFPIMSLEKGSTVFTRLPDCERPLGGSDTNDYMIACFLVFIEKRYVWMLQGWNEPELWEACGRFIVGNRSVDQRSLIFARGPAICANQSGKWPVHPQEGDTFLSSLYMFVCCIVVLICILNTSFPEGDHFVQTNQENDPHTHTRVTLFYPACTSMFVVLLLFFVYQTHLFLKATILCKQIRKMTLATLFGVNQATHLHLLHAVPLSLFLSCWLA